MNTLKTHSFALFSRFSCQQGPLVQSFHVKTFGLNSIRKNWDVDENQNYIFFKIAVLLPKFGFFLSIFLLNFFMTLARRVPDTCQRLTRTLLTWHQKWGQKHARVPYLWHCWAWTSPQSGVTILLRNLTYLLPHWFDLTNAIATQWLHSRPNVSTIQSSVFISGDLMLKLVTLYIVNLTVACS